MQWITQRLLGNSLKEERSSKPVVLFLYYELHGTAVGNTAWNSHRVCVEEESKVEEEHCLMSLQADTLKRRRCMLRESSNTCIKMMVRMVLTTLFRR